MLIGEYRHNLDAKKRIALGLKQLTPHPWDSLPEEIKEGARVKGKVVNIEDYGKLRDSTTGRGNRGKRITLKFRNSQAEQPYDVFKYQIVWELLKPTPNIVYTRRKT